MCNPQAVGMGMGAMQGMFAAQAENAAYDFKVMHHEANLKSSTAAAISKYQQTGIRQQQEDLASAQEKEQIASKSRNAIAAAAAGSSKGGVMGTGVSNALLNLYSNIGSKAIGNVEQEDDFRAAAFDFKQQAIEAEDETRKLSTLPGPAPNALGQWLSIAGSAMTGLTAGAGVASDKASADALSGTDSDWWDFLVGGE
jgi:hypothetical protein